MTKEQIQALPNDLIITGDYENKLIGLKHEGEFSGRILLPERSQKIRLHSPDGFSWGFGGSGPGQLALAILLEYFPHEIACANYMQFKWDHVSQWPQSDFEIKVDLRAFAVKYKL